ncbi:MAG: response regulator transcription factor [Rubrobacter sp.]
MDSYRPARLVIADDLDLIRMGLRKVLSREPDFEVVGEAENGREAVELCRRSEPDLVVMDVQMPEMDGLTATRKIKAELPSVAVLVFTAYEDPDYMLEAVRAGAAGNRPPDGRERQLERGLHGCTRRGALLRGRHDRRRGQRVRPLRREDRHRGHRPTGGD